MPVLGVAVEPLDPRAAAIAGGFGLRAWRDQHAPSFLATLGVAVLACATRWTGAGNGRGGAPPG